MSLVAIAAVASKPPGVLRDGLSLPRNDTLPETSPDSFPGNHGQKETSEANSFACQGVVC